MSEEYFSDRERGPRPRDVEEVSEAVWGGIVALVRGSVASGAFGVNFPDECPDGNGPVGCDEDSFSLALRAEVPGVPWPPQPYSVPDTLAALDLLEFCHRAVSEPIQKGYHQFFKHYHLSFDREAGQQKFCANVNRIFARNGAAFQLNDYGRIERLAPPGLREELATAEFNTGEAELDRLLNTARSKFLRPDPAERREALEKLWDAWERLKTIEPGKDKKASATALLDKAAPEAAFRVHLEQEAHELTLIGNKFQIRHTETTQTPLSQDRDVDYLFHRLFALIQLLLRARA